MASSVLNLLFLSGLGSYVSASPEPCLFTTGQHTYNLSSWAGRSVVAPGVDGSNSFNVSLCQNLVRDCYDSEVHVLMPSNNVRSMYHNEAPDTCWDVLAHWEDFQDVTEIGTAESPGIALRFSKPGDPHVECNPNVTVTINAICDRTVPPSQDPQASGSHPIGCDWEINLRTADDAVCKPGAPASYQIGEIAV